MAQDRKTRQQKIQQSKKKPTPQPVAQHNELLVSSQGDALPSYNKEIAETHVYVVAELKRIGWISLLCAAILFVATIFLADFAWTEAVRSWMSF